MSEDLYRIAFASLEQALETMEGYSKIDKQAIMVYTKMGLGQMD